MPFYVHLLVQDADNHDVIIIHNLVEYQMMSGIDSIFCSSCGRYSARQNADLAGEIVETAEKVPVYLLQAFDGADFDIVYQVAFKQGFSILKQNSVFVENAHKNTIYLCTSSPHTVRIGINF